MKITTFTLLVIMLFTVTDSLAQVANTDTTAIPHAYWVGGGIGLSSQGIELMANANAELSNKWLITAAAQIESGVFNGPETVTPYSLLVGKVFKRKSSLFAVSAGLSAVSVDDHPSKVTIGLPVILQTYAVVLQTFGVGLNLTANLNSYQPTVGFSINIGLGYMATHR
jgi:hypothetical protein